MNDATAAELSRLRLRPAQLAVYVALCELWTEAGTESVRVSVPRLADVSRYCSRTVRAALRGLEARGLVAVRARQGQTPEYRRLPLHNHSAPVARAA